MLKNVKLNSNVLYVVAGLAAVAMLAFGFNFVNGSDVVVEDAAVVEVSQPVIIPDGRYKLWGEVISRPSNNTVVLAVTDAKRIGGGPDWSFNFVQSGDGTAEDFIGRQIVVAIPNHNFLDRNEIGRFYNDKGERIYTGLFVSGDWNNSGVWVKASGNQDRGYLDGSGYGVLNAGGLLSAFEFEILYNQPNSYFGGSSNSLTP